jgi:hypothetical protein
MRLDKNPGHKLGLSLAKLKPQASKIIRLMKTP